MKKFNEDYYTIHSQGLGKTFYFSPGVFCGNIKCGISVGVDEIEGNWVIPLKEAWKMVLISTFAYIQCIYYGWNKRHGKHN